jgi:hypothetical protein
MEEESGFKFSTLLFTLLTLGVIGFLGYRFVLAGASQGLKWTNISPVTQQPVSIELNISSPDDGTVVYDKNLLVSGKTAPKALLIVSDNVDDLAVNADANGDFQANLILDSGFNHLVIQAFDSQGVAKQMVRDIYYSEDKLQ